MGLDGVGREGWRVRKVSQKYPPKIVMKRIDLLESNNLLHNFTDLYKKSIIKLFAL